MSEHSQAIPGRAVSAALMAKRLGVSAPTLRRLSRDGVIPYYKAGVLLRYDVDMVLSALRQTPTPKPQPQLAIA
jgi:excisionase family DNA binding protein